MRDLDFVGLADEARAAFKPDYSDVERRARHRRLNVRVGAAAVTVATLAAGGLAINGVTGGPRPNPVATPTPVPSYTQQGNAGPGPTWVRIHPDGWDVDRPDKPLTGMFTELRAGDMNNLYIEYQDCRVSPCVRMLAASADGGRTWRKHRLPLEVPSREGGVVAVRGTTVIASVWGRGLVDGPHYASVDGGLTWRTVTPMTVSALPAGWPLIGSRMNVIRAFDPATGDLAEIALGRKDAVRDGFTVFGQPPEAGIWQLRSGGQHLAVSRDGAATWQSRSLPDGIDLARTTGGTTLATLDGTAMVVVGGEGDALRLHVSHDGGIGWQAGAAITPDGPLLSILLTRDGAILLEAGSSVYRSTDGGATLRRVGPAIGYRAYAIPGGYAEPSDNQKYGVWLSPDGGTWTYVPPPPLP
jgi:hypothetical protein